MMPVGVPRVPYRLPRTNYWAWVDIWNCLYRERIVFLSKVSHAPTQVAPQQVLYGRVGTAPTGLRHHWQPRPRLVTCHALQAVDDELGNQLVATMLYLDSENKKDINMYINASGGDVVPCLALHDTMRHIGSDVATVGFGGVMGMSGFLLACGEPLPALVQAAQLGLVRRSGGRKFRLIQPRVGCAATRHVPQAFPRLADSQPASHASCQHVPVCVCEHAGKKGKRYTLQHTSIMLHHPTGVARGQASDVHNEGRELLRVRDYMDATLAVATGRSFSAIQADLERALYMSPQDAKEYGVIDRILQPHEVKVPAGSV
jgi:ATP-dependent protease ClpP protease subunit